MSGASVGHVHTLFLQLKVMGQSTATLHVIPDGAPPPLVPPPPVPVPALLLAPEVLLPPMA
jgi:hypothetical protein